LTLELRNEAIACLALADLKPGKAWPRQPGWSQPWAFDPTLQHYVVHSTSRGPPGKPDLHPGHLSIRRVADDEEVALLPGFGFQADMVRFSPDSCYLAARYGEVGRLHYYVWDLSRRGAILKVSYGYDTFPSFSPDSRRVALARPDHSIRVYDLPS